MLPRSDHSLTSRRISQLPYPRSQYLLTHPCSPSSGFLLFLTLLGTLHTPHTSAMSDSCNPMDGSSPGSSVHGILQARNWSELPFPSPGDLPDPVTEPMCLASPALAGGFFTNCTTREAHRQFILLVYPDYLLSPPIECGSLRKARTFSLFGSLCPSRSSINNC